MENKFKLIEDNYGVDVEEFLKLYINKYSRKQISEKLNIKEHIVRSIAGLLGLRLKQKFREIDYSFFMKSYKNKSIDNDIVNALEMTQNELYKINKQLLKQRDINTLLRKQLREQIKLENYFDIIKESIDNLPVEYIKDKTYNINFESNKNGVTIINFADLHIGAKVDCVGINNYYNFEIAKERIQEVINKTITNPLVSEELVINLLGDVFDGVIHNSHLIAEMPVMEAVYKFNVFFSEILNALLKAFKSITVNIISGNHERITEDQQVYKKGYDFTYIFSELLKATLKDKDNINIKYFIEGYGIIDIKDNYGVIFHGDIDRTYNVDNLKSILQVMYSFKIGDKEPILLLNGHTHKYKKVLLPNGGIAITLGSLMGQNEYSKNKGFLEYPPSQNILFYNKNTELLSERVVIL